jgi:aminoglycoside phosphotransferase family enzyme/predicted kinase
LDPLPAGLVDALAECEAFVGDASARRGVETIQTHISHVFLTRDRVYKLRKAVRLPFLSFATRSERNADCLNEVALNRRLAPDVYLGIAPVRPSADAGRWQLGAVSETVDDVSAEHCVVMRRLPDGRDALSLLGAGVLQGEQIDRLALRVVRFHAEQSLGVPAPYDADEWLRRTSAALAETFALAHQLDASVLDPHALADYQAWLEGIFEQRHVLFGRRRLQGRAVDGHADLRLDHVWLETPQAEPIVIDCVEFNAELRRIDVAADLAFFAMDLAYHDRSDLAERFLARYALETDDYDLYGVVDYFVAHRALIRAVVADVAANDADVPPKQRAAAQGSAARHMDLISRLRDPGHGPGLVLTTGTVGSGKSTVARAAAEYLEGGLISSDRTRKRLAGLASDARRKAAPGEGLYTDEHTREVYRGLLERAEPVVLSGRVAVLDATFARESWRASARSWAERRGLPVLLLDVRCRRAVALERLAAREGDARRVSDAGPEFLDESLRRYETPDAGWKSMQAVVRTDEESWREALTDALESWPRTGGDRA